MAKRKPGPHLALGNRLTDGRVVFFAADGTWSSDANQALSVEGPAIEALEADAARAALGHVIDLNIVQAAPDGKPLHIKHRIQATGPTIRRDLGYQAGNP